MRERKEFAERLNHLRSGKDISARDMSMSLGKSHGYINSIENCKIMPSMENFFLICDFLELTPQEFFDEDDQMPERTRLMVEAFKRMDEDLISHVMAIINAATKK